MKPYLFLFIVAISACNASKDNDSETTVQRPPISTIASLTPGCYQMVVDKDSAIFKMDIQGDSVTGLLQYNRFEKDDNVGNFVGKADSNKVVGWYKFQSEGVVTVRQVIFKIVDNKLAEGYGDVAATADTAYFTYPHTLNYEENHPFVKTTCP